ncbi:hypothetical protein [Microseira wollei]|uniref:PIN domain-containing protein n=1 Tax=Microseira wollei NIES-4236 TaxID=2530354 RepID=A0AAV3XBE2_9CYAN|nr:hypothetical protein [Microseira wollei]GET37597.1 hypothetical protein MiSe_23510 [Microseira wollei NIES-4236]
MHIVGSHILLDACCILNFSASGQLLAILKSIPAQVAVTQVVREQELKTLQRLEQEENDGATQFETAIEQNLLTVVDFESEDEAESFVNYSTILGDGESATCAIAVHRRWAIATDDKKAIAFFQRTAPYLQVLSTLEIIKHWSEEAALDAQTLRDLFNAVRLKGHYMPQKTHPLRSWWESLIN